MRDIVGAMQIVFQNKKNILIGMVSGSVFGAVFALGSGMVTFFEEGPFIEVNFLRIGTLLSITLLSGVVIPMQVFAIQKARRSLRTSSSGIGGMLVGIATMSCCTPLLLPAALSFVGFSGTQLLFLNMTIRQYVLPLSIISIGLLALSLLMVSRSVIAACRLYKRRII